VPEGNLDFQKLLPNTSGLTSQADPTNKQSSRKSLSILEDQS